MTVLVRALGSAVAVTHGAFVVASVEVGVGGTATVIGTSVAAQAPPFFGNEQLACPDTDPM
jgi:hypothetical protein